MSDPEPANTAPKPRPVIFGLSGLELTAHEQLFFRQANPFGFILFKRNCETPDQVRYLILELQQAVGRDTVTIAIDQEGGRVARLQPPHWPHYPPARMFGAMYEQDAEMASEAMLCYSRIVANELARLGITMNCAPVVDLHIQGATHAIGDRAMSARPEVVAALARVWAETMLANGVLPVIKHYPGHGRLKADPHHELPVIEATRAELESADFVPFELLKDLPVGMNSHAIFKALDPDNPVSLSSIVHQDIIRGQLGFDGLLLSDDLTMKALNGPPGEIAERSLEAGADIVLHCSGDLEQMKDIAEAIGPIAIDSWNRWTYASLMVKASDPRYHPSEDSARLDMLLGGVAYNDKK